MIENALVSTRDQYDHLFAIYVPIAAGVFALIVIVVLTSVLRYRRRADPARWSESNRLEASYAGLLVLPSPPFLIYLTLTAEAQVDTVANHERPRRHRRCHGGQMGVGVSLPRGRDRRPERNRRTPAAGRPRPARRSASTSPSQDVIHSLWVPEVRFKRDLIPGMIEHRDPDLHAAPACSPGQCAEFCGLRHADMVFDVRALLAGGVSPPGPGPHAQGAAS